MPPSPEEEADYVEKCRTLNDQLRAEFSGGQIVTTRGVQNLDDAIRNRVFKAIQSFDDFTESNDPYGTHEFGGVEVDGIRVWFKIDAYDTQLEYGSPDASNPNVTTRVMTILLPEEY